jgi:hypothetical protein
MRPEPTYLCASQARCPASSSCHHISQLLVPRCAQATAGSVLDRHAPGPPNSVMRRAIRHAARPAAPRPAAHVDRSLVLERDRVARRHAGRAQPPGEVIAAGRSAGHRQGRHMVDGLVGKTARHDVARAAAGRRALERRREAILPWPLCTQIDSSTIQIKSIRFIVPIREM